MGESLKVWGYPGPHSKFWVSQGYSVKSCHKHIHTNAGITESVDKNIKTLQVCPTWKSKTKGCQGEKK